MVKANVSAIVIAIFYKEDACAAKDHKKYSQHAYMPQYAKSVFGKEPYNGVFMQVANVFHIHFRAVKLLQIYSGLPGGGFKIVPNRVFIIQNRYSRGLVEFIFGLV